MFTFNGAVKCLLVAQVGVDHRRSPITSVTRAISVSPSSPKEAGYGKQKPRELLRGLLSGKDNLKQEPSQTTLSHYPLALSLRLSPEGAGIYGSTACRMEQIVHGSNLSLWHWGGGVGWGSSGRAVWDSMTYRSLVGRGGVGRCGEGVGRVVTGTAMKTSTSSRHICVRFLSSRAPLSFNSLLWGLISTNICTPVRGCHRWSLRFSRDATHI